MKITRTAKEALNFDEMKNNANKGCKVCPCCGKPLPKLYFPICKSWTEGFLKMKNMKVDCYKCYTCGAEWESEPYQWT